MKYQIGIDMAEAQTPPEAIPYSNAPAEAPLKPVASQAADGGGVGERATPRGDESVDNEKQPDPVAQAMAEFQGKFTRMMQLANDAMTRNAPTESLFRDEEFKPVQARLTAFQQRFSEARTPDDVEAVINDMGAWAEKTQTTLGQRLRAMTGYFGGSLPDGMEEQKRLFQGSFLDVANMKRYLAAKK